MKPFTCTRTGMFDHERYMSDVWLPSVTERIAHIQGSADVRDGAYQNANRPMNEPNRRSRRDIFCVECKIRMENLRQIVR